MGERWYKNNYRRNLIDMHINDWNDEFLSRFNADDYFDYLKKAKVNSAMIYLQSHVGLCYYPTKTGEMHKAFVGREDTVRRLIDRCRKNGISVVGYYSLIFNTVEHDKHPEWRLVQDDKTGRSQRQIGKIWWGRYGHCCPNNQGYRDFLKLQIKEISEYFELDGMFYDMTYWPGEESCCLCDSCKARFKQETGKDIPQTKDFHDPTFRLLIQKRYEWIAEFCRWVSDYTREVMPNITVSHNNAYSVAGDYRQGVCEMASDNCDYLAGDLYGDVYDHSFCIKYYYGATVNQPFEYMTSRFSEGLTQHTLTKTQTKLLQDTMLITAHHGASLLIDSIDPRGTLDMRVADKIGVAYEKMMPYEQYIKRGELVEDIAVWYSTTGRYNSEDQGFNSRSCAKNLTKTLILNNVPVGVMANTKTETMSKYKMVFAPAIAGITEKHRNDIYDYVKNGGVFYFSGVEDEALLRELLGARCTGFTSHEHTYVAPIVGKEELFYGFSEDYPLTMTYRHPYIELKEPNAQVVARLEMPYSDAYDNDHFASIHSNPPGILTEYPSVVISKYGSGTVIWSALPIEEYEGYQYTNIIMNIVRIYFPESEQSIITNAPAQIETVAFAGDGEILISSVDMGVTEDRLKLPAFNISVALDRLPKKVELLPDNTDVKFTYDGKRISFDTRALDLFDMYRIEF